VSVQKALNDTNWARQARDRLAHDAARLDTMMTATGAQIVGGAQRCSGMMWATPSCSRPIGAGPYLEPMYFRSMNFWLRRSGHDPIRRS
jgi:cobalamin biosynthetic protein CobC